MSTERLDAGANMFALAIFVVALWAQVDGYAGHQFVDGLNLGLAKALASGHGFTQVYSPDAPPASTPFLYPWILSVLWRIWPDFPDNLVLIRLFGASTMAIVAWELARYAVSLPVARLAVYSGLAFGMLFPPVLELGVSHSGELLGVALVTGAVTVADRGATGATRAMAAGVLTGLAGLCVEPLAAAVVGVATSYFLKKRWSLAVLSVVSFAGVFGLRLMAGWGTPVEAGGTTPWLGAAPVLSGLPNVVALAAIGLVVALAVWGGYALIETAPALAMSLVVILILLPVGPWPLGRVAWAVWPWTALLAAVGGVRAWAARRVLRVPIGLGLTVLGVLLAADIVFGLARRTFTRASMPYEAQYRLLIPSVQNEVPSNAILAAESPPLIHLYSGHLAVSSVLPPGDSTARTEFGDNLCRRGVTHLVSVRRDDPALAAFRATRHGVEVEFEHRNGASLYSVLCAP